MYRIYRKIHCSFQGDFEFFVKKWYILDKIYVILQLFSWSLPDDEGGITCMGSPFHHVYHIDSDFKHIFPDLTHDFKTFFNNSSDERLCVDIKDRFLTSKFDTGRVKLMFFFCGERIITSTQPSFRHNRVRHKQG